MPDAGQATRFREIRRLGAGGMATVTLAEDMLLGRLVALKRVYGSGDSRAMLRMKREALVGASLNHPNIVFVYDARLEDDGDVVIIMEYVDGQTLADLIRSRGPLLPSEVGRVSRGVAAALDAIHERGIVHRDVKPANILLGSDKSVKLADLGVAHVADRTRITSANAVVGSFSYMAPEQLDGGRPSPAMDIYALAAVVYEMLTGEKARPESNPLTLAHAIATRPPPDLRQALPGTPAAAATVLQRGMSADPSERPRSASELVRRLEAAYEPESPTQSAAVPGPPPRVPLPPPPRKRPSDRPVPPADQTAAPRTARRRLRRPMLAPALLALAALAVVVVVIAALGGGGKKASSTGTSTPHTTAAGPARTRSSRSATATRAKSHGAATTPSSPSIGTPSPAHSSSSAASGTPPAAGGSSSATGRTASSTPSGAVERFYETAADHQYSTAWSLADPNLQSQLGGYTSFQNTFSSVRSITFHSAEVLSGSTSNVATVALRTTSVQTDRTQQCSGTARTVRTNGAWLLDHISIGCT